MNTTSDRDPLDRIATNIPRLQGLYRDERSQAQKVSRLATRALEATKKGEQERREAAQGANNMAAVEKTELARQKAVNELEKARFKLMEIQASIADYGHLTIRNSGDVISWSDLDGLAVRRRRQGWGLGAPKEADIDLAVVNTAASEMKDDKGFFLRLAGVISNTGDKSATVPDFIVTILDEKGFALRNVLATTGGRVRLPAGGAQRFSHDVRPSPRHVGRILINFATGAEPPPELPVGLVCEASAPRELQ